MRHKVLDLLKTFSPEDSERFNDFLNSPFFNNSKKLVNLYNLLLKYHPDYDLTGLTDEGLSKMINPSISYNKSTTMALFSDLHHACLEYFKVTNFLKKEVEAADYLRNELFNRKLFKEIGSNIDTFEKSIETDTMVNADYFLNKFKLATDKANLFHLSALKSNNKKLDSDAEYVTERGKFLIYFFVTEIIREYDNLITMAKTFNSLKKNNLIIEMFSRINLSETLDFLILHEKNKACSAIFEVYKVLLNSILYFEDERSYFEYKKILVKNIDFLSIDEKRFHFRGLMKNCILRREMNWNSGKIDYELFNLYEFILKKGYYKSSVSEFLSVDLYRNILILALRLKKYKWVVNFIKTYTRKINPARRKNIYYYSLAEYYFKRKMYKDALLNYHKIENDDFILKVDMRNQMLIAYYELHNFENALSMIDSYYHFLSQDAVLSSSQKKLYRNFVKTVHMLILYNTSTNRSSLTEIEMQIKKDMPFREWINEKIIDTYNSSRTKIYLKNAYNKNTYSKKG